MENPLQEKKVIQAYTKPIEIRWSDLDPNFHVRHSVYYDMGAYIRMCFLTEFGLGTAVLQQHMVGPILFREECKFKREIKFGDQVEINLWLTQCTHSYSRWTIEHEIVINKETVAAIITVDGAWMDITKRKLTIPQALVTPTFELFPRRAEFKWM